MEAFAIRGDGPQRFSSWIRVLAMAALLSGLAVLNGCGSGDESSGLNGMTRTPPTKVGSVWTPNQNPNRENRADLLKPAGDGLMLVYFGYTSCPDVCPTTLADLRLALAELSPEQRDRIEVGMVTVDPARDTGKVLNGYLGHFFAKGSFASFVAGTPDQLARAEEAFGASHKLGEPHKGGSYDVDHTAQVYAVDSDGVIQVEWPFGTVSEDIAADLKVLLADTESAPETENTKVSQSKGTK